MSNSSSISAARAQFSSRQNFMEVPESGSWGCDSIAILLSQEGVASGGNSERVEPLPHIDYNLLYNLISLRRGAGDRREWKRYDYLVQARKAYYRIHGEFQMAFHAFQDAHAYDIILNREKAKLEVLGTATAKQLEHNETERQKNLHDLKYRYKKMTMARKRRDEITFEFSKMKMVFVKTEMPWLLQYAKNAYAHVMNIQAPPIPPPIPRPPAPITTNTKIPFPFQPHPPTHPNLPTNTTQLQTPFRPRGSAEATSSMDVETEMSRVGVVTNLGVVFFGRDGDIDGDDVVMGGE